MEAGELLGSVISTLCVRFQLSKIEVENWAPVFSIVAEGLKDVKDAAFGYAAIDMDYRDRELFFPPCS